MVEYIGPRGIFRNVEIMRFVRKLSPDLAVLEVGAGKLGLTFELLSHYERVTAIDLSPEIHGAAQKIPLELRRQLTHLDGDLMQLSLDEQSFDVIIACEVLEHIEDEASFIQRINALLAPGGYMIISVPAHMRLWSKHDEIVGHLRRYERADLMRVAHNLPYSQVQVVAYGFPWINLLRWFRIALAKTSLKSMQKLDTQERTVASGQLHKQLKWLNIVINKYTIMPFSCFSRLFSDSDYSDGYLLFVRKSEPDS